MDNGYRRNREEPKLRQELRGWQIFFIVLTAVVGEGIFYNNGPALQLAGPAGLLVAFFVVSCVATMVMEGISEFIQLFPAPNALYEYVRAFLDEDLAWLVGIAYWYTFAADFACQNIAAADHASTFMSDNVKQWQIVGFYVISPFVLTIINLLGVRIYGWVETVGGILKIGLLLLCACVLFSIAGTGGTYCPPADRLAVGEELMQPCSNSTRHISIDFHYNSRYVYNNIQGVIYAMPLVLFSFLSMEAFIVTAYEAKKPSDLRWPSQWMAYFVSCFYLLLTIAEILTVRWYDIDLPEVFAALSGNPNPSNNDDASSSTLVIIAANRAKNLYIHKHIPKLFSGCLVYSNLSAANTSLYLGSRTLYGIAREVPRTNWLGKQFHKLSIVEPHTGVPIAALLFTMLSFFWLPFLTAKGETLSTDETIQVIADSTSICTLMIWGLLSFAFIRYIQWLDLCEDAVRKRFPRFDRKSINYPHHTVFRKLQPLPAWIGLVGCMCFFGFASGSLWRIPRSTPSSVIVSNVASAYGAPIILLAGYILLKLLNIYKRWDTRNKWGWIFLSPNPADFESGLLRLEWNKNDPDETPDIQIQDTDHGNIQQANGSSVGPDSTMMTRFQSHGVSNASETPTGLALRGVALHSERSQQSSQGSRDPSELYS